MGMQSSVRDAARWIACALFTAMTATVGLSQVESRPAPRSGGGSELPPSAIERSQMRERAISRLVQLSRDEWALIRANAIEGLIPAPGRLREVLPEALLDLNEGVRSVAAMAVGEARIVELAARVEPLRHDPSPFVRASAIYALARCGKGVDPSPLADLLLAGESPRVRAHAAFVLGELGNASAVPMLRQASAREMPLASAAEMRLLRLQIAEAMVKLGAAEEQIHVVRAALFPSRPDELEATALAVQIIGNVRDEHSVGLLAQMVGSEQDGGSATRPMPAEVRLAAVGALAEMGRPQGRFAVDPYVTDPSPAIRAQAAHVLGLLGRAEDMRILEAMSERDSEKSVRVAAAAALVSMAEAPAPIGAAR